MNIELTEEQAEEFQATGSITLTMPEEKPKQWEPKTPEMDQIYWFKNGGGISVASDSWTRHETDLKRLVDGNVYLSGAAAKADTEADRKRNRLRAWLRENDDGWVADWNNDMQGKWVVVFKHQTKEWIAASFVNYAEVGLSYMSKPNAEKLQDLLNSGEVIENE
jgi:hypothetical protein